MKADRAALLGIYQRLLERHGARNWWPAQSAFEVMVGAILTQNTAWRNVERALDNLRQADALDPQSIVSASHESLATWLRPSGYFNVKAKRLRAWCEWYLNEGGFEALNRLPDKTLRQRVLGVHGIGPETADDIVLYAFERPVFVIDAYTRRLFSRLGYIDGDEPYELLRAWFERSLGLDTALFNEFHAQIDGHAARVCKRRPLCAECCLRLCCTHAQGVSD